MSDVSVDIRTCPDCGTDHPHLSCMSNLRCPSCRVAAERARTVALLRKWADAVETGMLMAQISPDRGRIRTLREAADAIEQGEPMPAWAR